MGLKSLFKKVTLQISGKKSTSKPQLVLHVGKVKVMKNTSIVQNNYHRMIIYTSFSVKNFTFLFLFIL